MTPAEIAEAKRLCEALKIHKWSVVRPWDSVRIVETDAYGNTLRLVAALAKSEGRIEDAEVDAVEILAARILLPKALAHIQAQSEQLRRAQAEGAQLREALMVYADYHQDDGLHNEPCPMDDTCECHKVKLVNDALSGKTAITAYAARVARMEEALREIAEESPVRLDGWVRNRALAALEGDG